MVAPAERADGRTARDTQPPARRVGVAETRIVAALSALRAGTLLDLVRQHDRVVRRYLPHVLQPVLATAGDRLPHDGRTAQAVALWLRWAVIQLCPEPHDDFDQIERTAWLDRTSWRPALANACHYGLAKVPDFRDRYRRRADESAADNLCGLWAVGPSTFYRYLDKGKRQLALLLLRCRAPEHSTMSLRAFVHRQLALQRPGPAGEDARRDWHRAMARDCQAQRDPVSALWHCLQSADPSGFIGLLHRHRVELAERPETGQLVDALVLAPLTDRQRFDLSVAQAELARHRGEDDAELRFYDAALQVASASGDPLMLGEIYGALGKYHELRDADRAFACYEDSARFLRLTSSRGNEPCAPPAAASYAHTLVRLAWLMISRNDPKAVTVLEQVQALRESHSVPDELAAMAEQTWGEYWRRAGDSRRALECKHRALNIFERLGDQRSILVTYINLGLLYAEVRDFDRALAYGRRVLAYAAKGSLAPEMLVSVHGNLGVTHFWQGDYDEAIRSYQRALDICQDSGLHTPLSNLHLNLAEAFYTRFALTRDAEDERRGDMHAAVSMRTSPSARDQSYLEVTRKLKSDILGAPAQTPSYDRLLPDEFAAHFEQMLQVQQHRGVLALPSAPETHARSRLAIARAYLAIAAKEREAALALIRRHGLENRFADDLAGLRDTFNRDLAREEQLDALWRTQANDLLRDDQRRAALLAQLLREGSVNKSGYASLCGLGPATASKHLGALAERGLLVQSGKGPSTRYRLPPSA